MSVLDKRLVNRSFAAAANEYDSNAELQRKVGLQLLKRFPPSSLLPTGREKPRGFFARN